jgi:hypothetical protein
MFNWKRKKQQWKMGGKTEKLNVIRDGIFFLTVSLLGLRIILWIMRSIIGI